jgi:ATP-dependent Lon protease
LELEFFVRYLYKSESISIPQRLLFIPLKETLIFPYVVAPLFFQSDEALAILNKVLLENSLIGCVGLRDPYLKDPQPKDLLAIGTVCKILQLVKLPNRGMKILVEGLSRVLLQNITRETPYFKADINEINEHQERTVLSGTLVQSIGTLFKISLSVGKPLPEEMLKTLDKIDHPGRLADLIAITLHLGLKEQQEIFETIDPLERLKKVFHHFNREIQSSPTRPHPLLNPGKEAGKFQKDHSLRPPLRGQREVPEEDPYLAEIHELGEKVRNPGMPEKVEEIATICRKIAKEVAMGNTPKEIIDEMAVEDLLGPRKFFREVAQERDRVGVATGLAWTENGGDIIFIETSKMKGEKGLILTGSLGEVMKKSAQAALSYIRTNAASLHIPENFYQECDIHIHIPAGATPKDGPSAGITIATAVLSLLKEKPVPHEMAMTGELTLGGRVLPVGGIKEKILAARRAGVKTVILPKKNEKNLDDIPDYIKKEMNFILVEHIQEVLDLTLPS